MEYINIDLSEKKYGKTRKFELINYSLAAGSGIMILLGVIFILISLSINLSFEKKQNDLENKLAKIKMEVQNEEKKAKMVEAESENIKIDESKVKKAEEIFGEIGDNTATEILNKIENGMSKEIYLDQFTLYDQKVNLSIIYTKENLFMEFVNNLQKTFKDVFILENKDGIVKIEINL